MIKTILQVLRQRPPPATGAASSFMSTEAPILSASALKLPGVYWYFGPRLDLPTLVDVRKEADGRLVVAFRDRRGSDDPATLSGYFDGPMTDLPPPTTAAGDL